MTIDKKFNESLGTGRTNESNGINKKEAFCIWWKVLLKWWRHQKQAHQKQDH